MYLPTLIALECLNSCKVMGRFLTRIFKAEFLQIKILTYNIKEKNSLDPHPPYYFQYDTLTIPNWTCFKALNATLCMYHIHMYVQVF